MSALTSGRDVGAPPTPPTTKRRTPASVEVEVAFSGPDFGARYQAARASTAAAYSDGVSRMPRTTAHSAHPWCGREETSKVVGDDTRTGTALPPSETARETLTRSWAREPSTIGTARVVQLGRSTNAGRMTGWKCRLLSRSMTSSARALAAQSCSSVLSPSAYSVGL